MGFNSGFKELTTEFFPSLQAIRNSHVGLQIEKVFHP